MGKTQEDRVRWITTKNLLTPPRADRPFWETGVSAVWISLLIAIAASADVIHVDDDAPNDPGPGTPHISDPLEDGSAAHPFDAIAEAIDAALNGDEVEIAEGTYRGTGNVNLTTAGKRITIRSANGPDNCTIELAPLLDDPNGPFSTAAFHFNSMEGPDTVLEGITIRGSPDFFPSGPALSCVGASPTIRDCHVVDNTAPAFSPQFGQLLGMDFSQSSSRLENCSVTRCLSGSDGHPSAAYFYDCNMTVRNCRFGQNISLFVPTVKVSDGQVEFVGCTFDRNLSTFAVVSTSGAHVQFNHCTFTGNIVPIEEYTRGVFWVRYGAARIANSILWNNTVGIGEADDPNDLTFRYSLIEGGAPGPGNFDADPRFAADGSHVLADSPAFGAGEPNAPGGGFDADGDPIPKGAGTIGADEFVDTDGDALPDWFERRYFGDPTAADAGDDVDGDSLSNLDEYEESRNPVRAAPTLYVAVDGDDESDGLAPVWDGVHGPKATITSAVDAADALEPGEIVLTSGVYSGPAFVDMSTASKPLTIRGSSGADETIIDGGGGASVFRIDAIGASPTLEGLTIRNGAIGIDCDRSAVRLRSCVVEDCAARGISAGESTVSVEDCIIRNNHAGGMIVYAGSLSMSDTIVSDNVRGGGLNLSASFARIRGCAISNNRRAADGGGIFGVPSRVQIANSIIAGNVADNGGGMLVDDVECANLLVVSNTARAAGGGVRSATQNPVRISCSTIAGNTAQSGGGLDTEGPLLVDNTIVYGNSVSGAGHELRARWEGASVLVRNSILGDADNALMIFGGAQLDADDTVIYGDPLYRDAAGPDGDPTTWEDNDYRLATGSPGIDSGGIELLAADFADVDNDRVTIEKTPRDLDRHRRIVDCAVDIGAFESPYETTYFADINNDGIPDECQCVADTNADGAVDLADLSALLTAFGATNGATFTQGDLDGDGDVDLSDLAAMLAQFGRTCG